MATDAGKDDVIVVGAGPVGMTAAALLARRGIGVTVLERLPRPSSEPKAISLDDESLRTYQSVGLAERVMSIVVPGTGTMYYAADGRPLFHAKGPAPLRLGHPFKNPFAQPDLERQLLTTLQRSLDVPVHYATTVTAVRDVGDGVAVTSRSGDRERTHRARYVIGADGGRSTVREGLGIGMTGRSFTQTWLVMDLLDDDHDERFGMHHGDPQRPHVIVPGLDGRCRYEFLLHPGECEPGATPPFDLMHRLVAPYRGLRPEQVERAVAYRFHTLVADHWQRGRVFLAGDAAHMMPPFAGQGLNSGIRDVANLTWKLAEVLHGRLAPETLGSYEAERRPHAEATARLSARLGRIVMTTSPRLAAHRDRALRGVLATPDGRRYLEEMRYRPALHLRSGLVLGVVASGGVSALRVGTMLAQPRVFDVTAHRDVLLDDVLGSGWALLAVDVPVAELAEVADVVTVTGANAVVATGGDRFPRPPAGWRGVADLDGRLIAEVEGLRGCFVLVRPDRIVAAVWSPGDTPRVERALRCWSARTPATASAATPELSVATDRTAS